MKFNFNKVERLKKQNRIEFQLCEDVFIADFTNSL